MRRNDRAVTALAEQLAILEKCPIARIGLVAGGADMDAAESASCTEPAVCREPTTCTEPVACTDTNIASSIVPYIVPMHFAYAMEGTTLQLYFHCANEGRKLSLMAKNPRVCFEADRLISTVPAGEACAWSAHYESVMGEGVLEVVTAQADKIAALDLLMRRYGYTEKPMYGEAALKAVTVLRLTVTRITGKRA